MAKETLRTRRELLTVMGSAITSRIAPLISSFLSPH
jgi:hypothetical protein